MIRKLITALILLPLAVLLVAFAVANRQTVVVTFDPFDATQPTLAFPLPLFALMLAIATAGVIVGGWAAWLRQRKWRARARRFEFEARRLRAENEHLRKRIGTAEFPASSVPVVDAPRLTIPPPA
jgi:uncharacterized integral membrane protein